VAAPNSFPRRLVAAVAALAIVLVATACGSSTSGAGASAGGLAPSAAVSSLPTVLVTELPAQAVDTLRLIAADGPFPYPKDGATFSNRERLLPAHPSGWYREYTVVTPGSNDRGARRIIAGDDHARFYTDDHYASFREVLSGVQS
jgi:ribonuclease T1